MAQFESVQDIINGAAVELGFDPAVDVLSSSDASFRQLRYLLDAAGQELVLLDDWTHLQKEHSITTTSADSGIYDLPTDFSHMIPQTGWDRVNQSPLAGPLSPQKWQYLIASQIGAEVYAYFRIKQNKFAIYPNNPVIDGLQIYFEYIRNTWVQDADEETTLRTKVSVTTDLVLFPPILVKKFLKVKFLEAKGMASDKARDDFSLMFDSASGKDGSSPILNAAGPRTLYPYLDARINVPDSGYGS